MICKKHIGSAIFCVLLSVFALNAVYAQEKVSEERQKLIDFGFELLGTPYKYAGRSPAGFDCSGFVSYVAEHSANKKLSPQSSSMYAQLEHIAAKDREPGDLVFFAYKASNGSYVIQHVGIYLGMYHGSNKALDGKYVFLHSASAGKYTGVIVSSLDEKYWDNLFYGYARFLPSSAK